jgi:hypothetical protein
LTVVAMRASNEDCSLYPDAGDNTHHCRHCASLQYGSGNIAASHV